jgi:hypothetical protein
MRVTIDDLDSELAACEEELPEDWILNSRRSCNDGFFGINDYPALTAVSRATNNPDLCEEYEGIQDSERYGRRGCYDFVGVGDSGSTFGFFLTAPVGGYKIWSRSGLSELPDHDNGNFDQTFKYFYLNYDIGISCAAEPVGPTCTACGSLSVRPSAWYAHAFLFLTIQEIRSRNGVNTQYFRQSFRALSGYYDLPIAVQTCEQLVNPTPREGIYCAPNERPTGCSPVSEYYPGESVEISVSFDDGVTAGDNTVAWTYQEDSINDSDGFTVDFPQDMKEPGGITVRLAERCCCYSYDEESGQYVSDYCSENPLP